MWRREEPSRPAPPSADRQNPAPAASAGTPSSDRDAGTGQDVVNIGKSVVIKGELKGSEDLTIEGRVEGKIELRQHVLTIGAHGQIEAELFAKSVVVMGKVNGNITASEKIEIRENGSVDGDVAAPRVAIAEGAHFRGSIDMQRTSGAQSSQGNSKPAAAPAARAASR